MYLPRLFIAYTPSNFLIHPVNKHSKTYLNQICKRMSQFVLLEELARAANSTELPYQMTVFFARETERDIKYAKELFVAYQELLDIVVQRNKMISEMKLVRPSVQMFKCLEFLKKLQKSDVIELLELKKKMAEAKLKLFNKHAFVKGL